MEEDAGVPLNTIMTFQLGSATHVMRRVTSVPVVHRVTAQGVTQLRTDSLMLSTSPVTARTPFMPPALSLSVSRNRQPPVQMGTPTIQQVVTVRTFVGTERLWISNVMMETPTALMAAAQNV